MINGQRVLAVIPARGGSKRLPRKNLRHFRDKPLLEWSLVVARRSRYIDTVVVSTEDPEILALAQSLGADVIIRPNELATDDATNEDVLRHALGERPDHGMVCLLQPTSPLRLAQDIDAVIGKGQGAMACVSYRPDGTKNGAVYACRSALILKGYTFGGGHIPHEMPEERSLDIDYEEQLHA